MTPNGPQLRVVTVGTTNDQLIEVTEGIKEGEDVALNPQSLLSEAEKRQYFGAGGTNDANSKAWATQPGKAAVVPGAPGTPGAVAEKGKGEPGAPGDAAKGKGKGQGKGKRGGGGGAAFFQKFQNMTPDDRDQLKSASPEERTQILKRAGFTDDELQQMQQMQQGGGGGGGFGGPGGGGGRGGPPGGPGQ
jgi:HlyD family secretion protein